MIIAFRVANFLSIREEQTLSFVAGTGKKIENEHHCISALDGKRPISLLKTMALYGPNAAGKSNFLVALRAMIRIIRDSNRLNTGEMIKDIVPFAFNRESREQASLFELTFLIKEEKRLVRYQYGFSADKHKVHEEWLISYPEGRGRTLLDRNHQEEPIWKGNAVNGPWSDTSLRTNCNTLFLSKAGGSENHPILAPIYQWLQDHILFIQSIDDHKIQEFTTDLYGQDPSFRAFLKQTLCNAGTCIDDLQIVDEPCEKFLPPEMPETIKRRILEDNPVVTQVKTIHRDTDGNQYQLDLEMESRGTQRLFILCGPIFEAFKRGALLVIDEMESSLHPILSRQLLSLFHDYQAKSPAQFVFTTHQTHLLDKKFLRRDQIWLVEKDEEQQTHLYSLWDFKVRNDLALEKAYLNGYFGAIPALESLINGPH